MVGTGERATGDAVRGLIPFVEDAWCPTCPEGHVVWFQADATPDVLQCAGCRPVADRFAGRWWLAGAPLSYGSERPVADPRSLPAKVVTASCFTAEALMAVTRLEPWEPDPSFVPARDLLRRPVDPADDQGAIRSPKRGVDRGSNRPRKR